MTDRERIDGIVSRHRTEAGDDPEFDELAILAYGLADRLNEEIGNAEFAAACADETADDCFASEAVMRAENEELKAKLRKLKAKLRKLRRRR